MTSANEWFKKVKSGAKLVQETAKSRIANITETIDKKLQEAQEDLEKQRSKAEASHLTSQQQQQKWKPSDKNPDGEIVTTIIPPPATITTNLPSPELPQASTPPVVELPTVRHKAAKRHSSKKHNSSSISCVSVDTDPELGNEEKKTITKKKDNSEDTKFYFNDTTNIIVNQEHVEKCLHELIDIVSTVDKLVEDTIVLTISQQQQQDLLLVQKSINHSETSIDTDKEESISSPINELTSMTNIDNDSLIASSPDQENSQTKILDDESWTSIKHYDSEDELPISTNITKSPTNHSDSEDDLSMLNNVVESPIECSNSEIESSIKHPDLEDELPTLPNIIKSTNEHLDINENQSNLSENIINSTSNDLEDSFDKMKIPNIQIQRPSEEPIRKSTDLSALRELIARIESNINDETLSSQQDTIVLEENVNKLPEQLDTNIKDPFLSTPSTLSDDIPDDNIIEYPIQNDSSSDIFLPDEKNDNISTISIEPNLIEKKRSPIVNCHLIPSNTKVSYINCSSTYIYICTNEQKIFYAKLYDNDINLTLQWYQHSELAEQLVVSITNRTVWRFINKHLYISNDSIKYPPIGSQWNKIKFDNHQSLLSISINDNYGWFIKEDGTLWLIRTDTDNSQMINVTCPFILKKVYCFSEKVGVTTNDGEILIRIGCTNDCPEGDGWIFIQHDFGIINDFVLLTNNNIISIVDKNHHLWIHQWTNDKGFFEILFNDEFLISSQKYLLCVNSNLLCFTDCEKYIQIFTDCLIGIRWTLIEENTRLQRLIGAFSDEDYVWTLTTDKKICSSNGHILEKPRQAQYLTHATFVPNKSSQDTILWSIDESCNIYVRDNVESETEWEQLDQSQFEWNRRLVHIVCNNVGVWAVDDHGYIHFRHGHMSASHNIHGNELTLLPPAWISIPGEAEKHRCFSQIFCGPEDWMVYATDNKQTVYVRVGITEENFIGTSWEVIEDCSALELAISEHTLWILTSCGNIQCRENISLSHPIGTRSITLPGFFLSLTVSIDDSQVWALDSKRNLLKLDRLTVLFEK